MKQRKIDVVKSRRWRAKAPPASERLKNGGSSIVVSEREIVFTNQNLATSGDSCFVL